MYAVARALAEQRAQLPIAEVERMAGQNELRDAKTLVALYRAKLKGLY